MVRSLIGCVVTNVAAMVQQSLVVGMLAKHGIRIIHCEDYNNIVGFIFIYLLGIGLLTTFPFFVLEDQGEHLWAIGVSAGLGVVFTFAWFGMLFVNIEIKNNGNSDE